MFRFLAGENTRRFCGAAAAALASAGMLSSPARADSAKPLSGPRQVFAWGSATYGETGHGHELLSGVGIPTLVDGLKAKTVVSVSSSGSAASSAALTREGTVYTWGCGAQSRLGLGRCDANQLLPAPVEGLPPACEIAIGEFHGAAITMDGRLWTWGSRGVGHSNPRGAGIPAPVDGLEGVVIRNVSCGREHTVAVDADGRVWSWGNGVTYALGHGNKADQSSAKQVAALADKKAVAASCGREHTLFLTEEGEVWAVGTDSYGQCGNNNRTAYVKTPVHVALPKPAVAVAAGEFHSFAITADGSVYSWGANRKGALGHGDTSDLGTPRLIEAPLKGRVVSVAAGGGHTLLLTDANVLYAVGRGRQGQLGRGDCVESVAAYRTTPVDVHVVSDAGAIVSIAAGRDHCLAVVEKRAALR